MVEKASGQENTSNTNKSEFVKNAEAAKGVFGRTVESKRLEVSKKMESSALEKSRLQDEYLVAKTKELSGLLGKDFVAISATQPTVAWLVQMRAGIGKNPEMSLKDLAQDIPEKNGGNFLTRGFQSKGMGLDIYKRRLTAFVGVSGFGDALMSDVLPSPDGIKSPNDVATVAIRSAAKAGMETSLTISNESASLHKFYSSKTPLPEFRNGLLKGILPRNKTIWLGVEVARAQEHDDPAKAAMVGAALGMAAGFVAGCIDNKITLSYAASSTGSGIRPLNPSALLAAGVMRSAQAAITAGALAGVSEMHRSFNGEDARESDKQEKSYQPDSSLNSLMIYKGGVEKLSNTPKVSEELKSVTKNLLTIDYKKNILDKGKNDVFKIKRHEGIKPKKEVANLSGSHAMKIKAKALDEANNNEKSR